MKRDDRSEARAIARFWEQFTYDKDNPAEVTMEGAAGFAQTHATLALADAVEHVAAALHRIATTLEKPGR